MRRTARTAGAALLLGAALAGCSGPAQRDSEAVATDHVDMPASYRFEPEVIEIAAGTTVTWTNSDNFSHDVVLLEPEEIDLGLAEPGARLSHTFEEAGSYRYQCSLHPQQMQGAVEVTTP